MDQLVMDDIGDALPPPRDTLPAAGAAAGPAAAPAAARVSPSGLDGPGRRQGGEASGPEKQRH
jgi:hypothetical protein